MVVSQLRYSHTHATAFTHALVDTAQSTHIRNRAPAGIQVCMMASAQYQVMLESMHAPNLIVVAYGNMLRAGNGAETVTQARHTNAGQAVCCASLFTLVSRKAAYGQTVGQSSHLEFAKCYHHQSNGVR